MYSLEELKKAETKITIIDKYDDDIRHVVDFDDIDDGFCIKEFIENEFGISFSESKKYQTDDIIKFLVEFSCMDADNERSNMEKPGTYRIKSKISEINNIIGNC